MKVKIEISDKYMEPEVVIYTNQINDQVNELMHILEVEKKPIIGQKDGRKLVIKGEDIYLVRSEEGKVYIYLDKEKYYSKEKLYEIERKLGDKFLRISKQSIINLDKLKNIEAGFNGNMYLRLSNGLTDMVTRKYLGDLKNYLGI